MRGLGASVKGFGAALVGGSVIAGLGALASNAFEMGSALTEAASKVGVTVEALQEMRYVASQNGVAIDTMEGSLNKMTKTLGELQLKNPAVARTFKQLGLSAQEMLGLTPTESFTKIADALSKVQDETTRAALGNKIFGRSYAELKPIVDLGVDGIRRAVEEKRKDGVISTEQAKKLDDLADGWQRLKDKVGVATAQFIANAAGSRDASQGLDNMGSAIGGLLADIGELFSALGKVELALRKFGRLIDERRRDSALTSWIPGMQEDAQKEIDRNNARIQQLQSNGGSKRGVRGGTGRVLPKLNQTSASNFGGTGLNAILGLTGFGDAGKGTGLNIKNLFDEAETEVSDFGDKWEAATERGIDANSEFKRSMEETVRDVTGSLSNFANSIKGGNFFGILQGVLGLLGSIGGALPNGLKIGPLKFPNSSQLPGFANGGAMKLGGMGGIDRNVLSMNGRPFLRTSRGETLQIKPQNDGGASGGVVRVLVQANDYFDARVAGQAGRVVAAAATPIASLGSNMAQRNLAHRGSRRLA